MKVLEIKDKRAFLNNPKTHTTSLMKDITEDDVLDIVQAILDGENIECDDIPLAEDCPNEAERVIYTELKSQLDKLKADRPEILSGIDAKFAEAEAFYKKNDSDISFDAWEVDSK